MQVTLVQHYLGYFLPKFVEIPDKYLLEFYEYCGKQYKSTVCGRVAA